MDNQFHYQIGKVSTEIPWTRPSYEMIKAFLTEVKKSTTIFDRYSINIAGGVLYDFNSTWDIDLFLHGGKQDPTVLEDDLHTLNNLALNSFCLLIDAQWCEDLIHDISFTDLTSPGFTDTPITYQRLGYASKRLNGITQTIDIRENEAITKLSEYLVELVKPYPDNNPKVINRILNNPHRILKATVPAEVILDEDIRYFLANTNR